MVQRKVADKLGIIYDDPMKSITTLSKPSFMQNSMDNKNSVTDLKKKKMMKKPGSMKRTELDGRRMKQPGNRLSIPAETPEKRQSPACSASEIPNYMKSTTSSVSKHEKSQMRNRKSENSSKLAAKTPTGLRTTRVLMKKCAEDPQKATCSSTLKDCKHPAYLELNPGGTVSEGTSVFKVCPYTYCSLNGHHKEPLPPLKSFLSSRRRILRTQRNTDNKTPDEKVVRSCELDDLASHPSSDRIADDSTEASSDLDEDGDGNSIEEIPVPLLDTEETEPEIFVTWNDFPTEILGVVQLDEQESEAFDMESDNIEYEYLSCEEKTTKLDNCSHEFQEKETSKDGNLNTSLPVEIPEEEKAEAIYEETTGINAEISGAAGEIYGMEDDEDGNNKLETMIAVDAVSDQHPSSDGALIEETFESGGLEDYAEDSNLEFVEQSPMDTECIIVNGGICDNACDATRVEIEGCSSTGKQEGGFMKGNLQEEMVNNDGFKLEIGTKRSNPESQEDGDFNPREPNFLPLQPVPEAEKVDLRHQELDEKKNAEEWMVDYALRQTVTKLGPARRKKVEFLVEAFEKVMPTEKCEMKLRHESSLSMPEQFMHVTCN